MEKLVKLIAAMTCVENGIKWEEVNKEAIWEGYRLAFKHSPCHPERSEGSEDINVGVNEIIRAKPSSTRLPPYGL